MDYIIHFLCLRCPRHCFITIVQYFFPHNKKEVLLFSHNMNVDVGEERHNRVVSVSLCCTESISTDQSRLALLEKERCRVTAPNSLNLRVYEKGEIGMSKQNRKNICWHVAY